MTLSSSEVLFVGKGNGAVSWVRTGAPAFYNGCDWVALAGEPPKDNLLFIAGLKRGGLSVPDLDQYKIIVLQQVDGLAWQREIFRLRDKGITVLYEVDDHLQSVRKIQGHAAAKAYSKKRVADHELCMRACDGLIVSTPFLAKAYKKFNSRVFVCRNSIEGSRYEQFEPPDRDGKLHVGWAGGEGHQQSIASWLPAIQRLLDSHDVRFISIGLEAAEDVEAEEGRTMALPFVVIENVPAVLCHMDIAIAPAGRSDFFRAKSDLRFLETGALGIPCVADPFVYDDIIHEETGLLAQNAAEAYAQLIRLVDDDELRMKISRNVREYVLTERTIEKEAQQWVEVFMQCAS